MTDAVIDLDALIKGLRNGEKPSFHYDVALKHQAADLLKHQRDLINSLKVEVNLEKMKNTDLLKEIVAIDACISRILGR